MTDPDDLLLALQGVRRQVLRLAADEPWCVTDLAAEAGVKQPTMSRHLQRLSDQGLVSLASGLSAEGGKVTSVRTQIPELERQLTELVKAIHPHGLAATGISFRTGNGEEVRTWT